MQRQTVPVLYIADESSPHDFAARLDSFVRLHVTTWSEVSEIGVSSGDIRVIVAHLDSTEGSENARRWEWLLRDASSLQRLVVRHDRGQAWKTADVPLTIMEARRDEDPADFAVRVATAIEVTWFRSREPQGVDYLELVLENSQVPMGIFNRGGYQVHCNEAFVTLFGARLPLDVSLFDLPHHQVPERQELHECLRQGSSACDAATWMNPHEQHPAGVDKRFCLSVEAFPIMVEGHMEYFVAVFHDVTARMEAEEALREANESLQVAHDKLEQRVRERTMEFEHLKNELARRNRELEDFSYRVGHDLKNGLFAIRTFLEMFERAPHEARALVPTLHETSDRLIDFVQRMLMMARAGRVIGARSPTDLGQVAREVFEGLRTTRGDAELVVIPPIPTVRVDPMAIEQVLRCLLDNCFQNSDPARKPLIGFSATSRDGHVEFRLRDNGKGIAQENLESVFTPLFSNGDHSHLGFGLQIVKKIVEGHGGRIRAESAGVGLGLEMVFEIPVG